MAINFPNTPTDGQLFSSSGRLWKFSTGKGWTSADNYSSATFQGAMVTRATDQTAANYTGTTLIPWDAEVYDTLDAHDNATNNTRLTVPGGVSMVRLVASVKVANATASQYAGLYLHKNGVSSFLGASAVFSTINNTTTYLNLSTGPISVAAGDYFELRLQLQADTSVDVIAAESFFSIEVISGIISNFIGCSVSRAADQTTANYATATAIPFTSEAYDVGGWHDNTTNNTRITVPSGVKYVVVSGSVLVGAQTAGEYFTATVRKNGSLGFNGATSMSLASGSTFQRINVRSGPIPVVSGDYFELFVQTAADTSITLTASELTFSAYAVG